MKIYDTNKRADSQGRDIILYDSFTSLPVMRSISRIYIQFTQSNYIF